MYLLSLCEFGTVRDKIKTPNQPTLVGVIDAEGNIVKHVIDLLSHPSTEIQLPAARVVGNIATGSDEQTTYLLELDILPRLKTLMGSSNPAHIRKEACWVLSNIAAGTIEQVRAVKF